MKKKMSAITAIFPELPSLRPICSPIGIIERSAPREKKPIPRMRRIAPSRKSTNVPIGIGARVKDSSRTMTVIGRTEDTASIIFSFRIFCNHFTSQSFYLDKTYNRGLLPFLLYHIGAGGCNPFFLR